MDKLTANEVTCPKLTNVSNLNGLTSSNLSSLDTTTSITLQLSDLTNSLTSYINNKFDLLFNNPDLSLNSILELSNSLLGDSNFATNIYNSLANKISLTKDHQDISAKYLRFTGNNHRFENSFLIPDVSLIDTSTNILSTKNEIKQLKTSVTNKISLTQDNQTISASYLNFTGDNHKFSNGFLIPDVFLVDTSTNILSTKNEIKQLKIDRDSALETVYNTRSFSANDLGISTVRKENSIINDRILNVRDGLGNEIRFVPNVGPGIYNFIANKGTGIFNKRVYSPDEPESCFTIANEQSDAASGIVIRDTSLLIGSGSAQSNLPSNYLHFNANGIGINKQTPSRTLDVNGNIQANDIFFTNYTNGILGSNTASLTQQLTATNNLLSSLVPLYQSLQTRTDTLVTNSVKAFGYFNGTSWTRGSKYIRTWMVGSAFGLYGYIVWLQNLDFEFALQEIITATPDSLNGGYTVVAKYGGNLQLPNSGDGFAKAMVISVYYGGQSPSVLTPSAFYFTLV
ncbi:MAG: hypothetical protein K2P99_07195 [Burkholderiales bacterium]|nr:hypothetical protein [Burkholderiales bacterium]